MNELKVFISHAHDDTVWVHKFAEALREHHIQVWLDDWEIKPGASIAEAFEAALRSSDAIVSVLTESNARRPNVAFEFGAALGMGKPLIPIIPADLEDAAIPFAFRSRRYLTRGEPDVAAREVAEALKARAA